MNSEYFGEAEIAPGETHYWWGEPMVYGETPLISAHAISGNPYAQDKHLQVDNISFITKTNGNIQLNFQVHNIGAEWAYYGIFWTRIFP